MSEAVKQLISQRGWEEQMALGRLKARWAEVVGDQVAARSEPVRLESGRLTIRVEGGAWAAELALLGPPSHRRPRISSAPGTSAKWPSWRGP